MFARLFVAAATFAVGMAQAVAAEVPVLTYHEFAPFASESKSGLSYELAKYLTEKSGGEYTFVVGVMPRKRLDGEVAAGKSVVVPWVNPAWFGDKEQTKYKWSAAVMKDANAVLSPTAKPVEFAGPDSLAGLKLGGVAGHKYPGVDPLVEAGKIAREDANSELINLKKVAAGRIDVTIMAESGARFIAKQEGLAAQVHFSTSPHSQYERHVFVAGSDAKLAAFVTGTINAMAGDPAWQSVVKSYQ